MMTDWNTGNETHADDQVELVYVDGIWLSRCRPIILSGWYRLRMVPYGSNGYGHV